VGYICFLVCSFGLDGLDNVDDDPEEEEYDDEDYNGRDIHYVVAAKTVFFTY
jgi:hypothetical protein